MRATPLLLAVLLAACSGPLAPEAESPPTVAVRAADAAPTAARARALLDAMERADTEAAGETVAALLLDAGLDLPDDLSWSLRAYDEPFNFYQSGLHRVMLSEMPTREQAPRYWAAWSGLLSSGTWAPEAFFHNAEEAQRLAAFNQAVLAAHELGHALAYRYAVNPRTDDGNVNCQELLADRVAAAVLDRLARADARFADIRSRYLALLASLNAAVLEASRYTMPPRQRLLADCRDTVVANPTDDPQSLVPYASAFFARHARLHEGGAPEPLATLADSVFLPRLRAYDADAPEASGPVSITTEGPYRVERDSLWPDFSERTSEMLAMMRDFGATEFEIATAAVAVSPEGAAWALSFHTTLLPDSASASTLARLTDLSGEGLYWDSDYGLDADGEAWSIEALAALSDSIFVGLAQLATVEDASEASFRLFRFQRDAGVQWGAALPLAPEADGYRLHRMPSGEVFLFGGGHFWRVDADGLALGPTFPSTRSARTPVVGMDLSSRGTLVADPTALGVQVYDEGRMSVGPGGSILYRVRRVDGETHRTRLAGSGFPSTRDSSDPDAVAFQEVLVAQPLADGTIVVIENQTWEGPRDAVVVRRLRVPE